MHHRADDPRSDGHPERRKHEEDDEQQDETVLLQDRPPTPGDLRRHEGEQGLRPVKRRDREEIEDHQHEVDDDEQVKHLQGQRRDLIDQRWVRQDVAKGDRGSGREHQGRQRPGGSDSRLAPSSTIETARAPIASPHRPPSRLRGFTGVGLAQPNPNVPCDPMKVIARRMPPNGSKWTIGFSERRPMKRAVLSPNRYAASAWENSWTGKPTSSMMATTMSA